MDEQSKQVTLVLMEGGMINRPAASAPLGDVDEQDLSICARGKADRGRLESVGA